jgi:hypothetical protein
MANPKRMTRSRLSVIAIGSAMCATLILPPTLVSPFAPPLLAQTQVRWLACPSPQLALKGSYAVQTLVVVRDGFSVFYRAACDDVTGSTTPTEAFRVVKRGWLSWRDLGGEDVSFYDAGCVQPTTSGQSVCCMVSLGEAEQYTAVFGRAVLPSVASVELTFDNGDVGRADVIGEKFVVATPYVASSAYMKVFDARGAVLDTIALDLSDDALASGATGCVS